MRLRLILTAAAVALATDAATAGPVRQAAQNARERRQARQADRRVPVAQQRQAVAFPAAATPCATGTTPVTGAACTTGTCPAPGIRR